MSNVFVDIISQFDSKGFKQADSAVTALTKKTLKLAGSYLTLQKAQQSVMAAISDEKASKVLAQNLKNLNLGFAIKSAEEFIATMQKQTGVLDDELRPAYAQLARVTGSSLETQKLMALAFDVSAGTGKDFTTVINTLSQAYVGNNKGLRSLNIGLSQADLKTKSFADITEILNKKFAGSGEASLDSYAGKMALLKVATADASEAIGKSLLDAITTASGSDGFPKFIRLIEGATNILTDLITGISRTIALIDIVASPSKGIGDIIKKVRNQYAIWNREDLEVAKQRNGVAKNYSSYYTKIAKAQVLATKNAKVQNQLEKDRLATLKKQNAEAAAQAIIDKANAMLYTANSVFDLEQIQVAAAMQNKTLTENERKRLEIKQAIFDLEAALEMNDQKRIQSGTTLLGELLKQFSALQKQDAILGKIKTAFDALGFNKDLINLQNLQDALKLLIEINKLLNAKKTTPTGKEAGGGSASGGASNPFIQAIGDATGRNAINVAVNAAVGAKTDAGLIANAMANSLIASGVKVNNALTTARYTGQAIDWWNKQVAEIDRLNAIGAAIAPGHTGISLTITENAKNLVDIVMETVTEQSASGSSPIVNRIDQALNW